MKKIADAFFDEIDCNEVLSSYSSESKNEKDGEEIDALSCGSESDNESEVEENSNSLLKLIPNE